MADHMVKMSEVPKGERWQHFWEYYRYKTIAVIGIIIAIAITVSAVLARKNPDISILTVYNQEFQEDVWKDIETACEIFDFDYNKDGKTQVGFTYVSSYTGMQSVTPQGHMAYWTQIMAYLASADHVLQIVDDETYTFFENESAIGTYGELNDLYGHQPEDPVKIPLKELKPFRDREGVPDNLFMTIRPKKAVLMGKMKNKPHFYEDQLALLYAMMN